MAITAGKNKNYGGTTVTQKYSPLEGIDFQRTDESVYSKLLTNRLNQLAAANVMPQPLRLVTDWEKSLSRGAADPPLVMISSNRSNWIAGGLRVAKEQKKETSYEGSNDLKALTGKIPGQRQSPPLYAPERTEGKRRIFIVVHELEYQTYREALMGSDVIVVGWSFATPAAAPAELTGFGASRYAAIEFCKYVRANKSGDRWNYAWLLDDNVVAISGFPGYAAVERAMAATRPTQVCSAFHGGSGVDSFTDTVAWAAAEVDAKPSRGKPTDLPATTTPIGIIQQAALWNIEYLAEQKLNFSPIFVASGEDVSLGNFFNLVVGATTTEPREPKPAIPYLYYGSLKVRKEHIPHHDDGDASRLVKAARERCQRWFSEREVVATPAGDTAPPPVSIVEGTSAAKTLARFIEDWWTGPVKDRPGVATEDVNERHKARCQAVEQIVCGAIKSEFVSKLAVNRTFLIPFAAPQVIQRRPLPALTRRD